MKPVNAHLQEASLPEKGGKLLGLLFRAERPEARSHSPRHDDSHKLFS
jgi:hypothetical protein